MLIIHPRCGAKDVPEDLPVSSFHPSEVMHHHARARGAFVLVNSSRSMEYYGPMMPVEYAGKSYSPEVHIGGVSPSLLTVSM